MNLIIVGVGTIAHHHQAKVAALMWELDALGIRTEMFLEDEYLEDEEKDVASIKHFRDTLSVLCGEPIGFHEIETIDYTPREFDISYCEEKVYRKGQYLRQLKDERLKTRALFKRYRGVNQK